MSDEVKQQPFAKMNFDLSGPPVRKILTPAEAEESQAIRPDMKICGTCRYFDHQPGQHAMKVTKFLTRLVRENNWQVKHLCSHPREIGFCGQSISGAGGDGATLTGFRHKACDMHRERNGLVQLRHTAR